MSYKPTFVSGDWLGICDACGRKLKASLLRKRWDGFLVCDRDWEPRQPQDFVKGVKEFQTPTFIRSIEQDTFIS